MEGSQASSVVSCYAWTRSSRDLRCGEDAAQNERCEWKSAVEGQCARTRARGRGEALLAYADTLANFRGADPELQLRLFRFRSASSLKQPSQHRSALILVFPLNPGTPKSCAVASREDDVSARGRRRADRPPPRQARLPPRRDHNRGRHARGGRRGRGLRRAALAQDYARRRRGGAGLLAAPRRRRPRDEARAFPHPNIVYIEQTLSTSPHKSPPPRGACSLSNRGSVAARAPNSSGAR